MLINVLQGAGHGGRGGQGQGQTKTGAPYGDLFEPVAVGCNGGIGSSAAGFGRGGGTIYLKINESLQVDGHVSVNGGAGSNRGGGGAGGSIWIDTQNISVRVYVSILVLV